MRYIDVCKNLIVSFILLILIMLLIIMTSVYDTLNYEKQIEYNKLKVSEYQKTVEEYKMKNEKIRYDLQEIKLKAFLKAYSNGTYITEEGEEIK